MSAAPAARTTAAGAAAGLPDAGPVILRNGTSAWLRPASPRDVGGLEALFGRASQRSLWLRFFTQKRFVDRHFIEQMAAAGTGGRVTCVVTRGEGAQEQIFGVGGYVCLPEPGVADIALFVDDAVQGLGIGTLLLEHLVTYARHAGIVKLTADVLAENERMLEVFRRSGFEPHFATDHETTHVEFLARTDAEAQTLIEGREQIATLASLAPLLRPRSVAVVGASHDPHGIGRVVFDRLLQAGFTGAVYPINPAVHSVGGVRAYSSVLDVPDDLDLAVIAIPAHRILDVVDQCARKGVRAVVVLSAGFAETGAEGRALQDALLRKVRGNGMRMVGPNCVGIMNTDPAIALNATFGPKSPVPGRIGMASQSGAMGVAILDFADRYALGVSSFVSVGNKADISTNDLLQYWEQDAATDVVMLYAESFGNPRRFARIARRVARRKPILALKSGRSAAGSRAAGSHTAALAGSDVAAEALFRQTGVLRVDTLEEFFAAASVLANQPLPAGNRVAIVTNAGGPGILAADACESAGLTLSAPSTATITALQKVLPPTAGLRNPIDMVAAAGPAEYKATLTALLQEAAIDAALVIHLPIGLHEPDAIAVAIMDAAASVPGKPVVACWLANQPAPAALMRPVTKPNASVSRPIPCFDFPETAARALARAAEYARERAAPEGTVPALKRVDAAAARTVIETALAARGDGWLRPDEAAHLLDAVGLRGPASSLATNVAEAAEVAEGMGFPVALKAISDGLLHKTEAGGVALNLASADAVRAAAARMQAGISLPLRGFLVQQMVPPGLELLVGVTDDPTFGPLIGFGLGGTAVEVLNDTVFRITPLTDTDAHTMVRSIRALPLLQGYRGRPAADLAAIEDVLLRVSWLVEEVPAIAEMDINPLVIVPDVPGPVCLDVRVRVRRSP